MLLHPARRPALQGRVPLTASIVGYDENKDHAETSSSILSPSPLLSARHKLRINRTGRGPVGDADLGGETCVNLLDEPAEPLGRQPVQSR